MPSQVWIAASSRPLPDFHALSSSPMTFAMSLLWCHAVAQMRALPAPSGTPWHMPLPVAASASTDASARCEPAWARCGARSASTCSAWCRSSSARAAFTLVSTSSFSCLVFTASAASSTSFWTGLAASPPAPCKRALSRAARAAGTSSCHAAARATRSARAAPGSSAAAISRARRRTSRRSSVTATASIWSHSAGVSPWRLPTSTLRARSHSAAARRLTSAATCTRSSTLLLPLRRRMPTSSSAPRPRVARAK